MNRPESHLNLLVNQREKTLIYSQAERCQGTVEGEVLSVFFLINDFKRRAAMCISFLGSP